MDNAQSVIEVLRFCAFTITILVGLFVALRAPGAIDWGKTVSSLGEVLRRAQQLREEGHLENVQQAGDFAVKAIQKIRKRRRLPRRTLHKIREHVALRLAHLDGEEGTDDANDVD